MQVSLVIVEVEVCIGPRQPFATIPFVWIELYYSAFDCTYLAARAHRAWFSNGILSCYMAPKVTPRQGCDCVMWYAVALFCCACHVWYAVAQFR